MLAASRWLWGISGLAGKCLGNFQGLAGTRIGTEPTVLVLIVGKCSIAHSHLPLWFSSCEGKSLLDVPPTPVPGGRGFWPGESNSFSEPLLKQAGD